jgi:hypothetical protein
MLGLPPSAQGRGRIRGLHRGIEQLFCQQFGEVKSAPKPARFRRRVRLTHRLLEQIEWQIRTGGTFVVE